MIKEIDIMKKIFIMLLFIVVLVTGCGDNNYQIGDIENYHYEEVEEQTNYVKLVTNSNKVILIELYPDIAPITVEKFQNLVKDHFYDNLIFHRVIENFMIQGGAYDRNNNIKETDTIVGEFKNNGYDNNIKHEEGTVSMARANDMNSASSQFFICVNSNEYLNYLDGDYAAFGKVIAGYDEVVEISKVSTDQYDMPTIPQIIKTIRFVKISENK